MYVCARVCQIVIKLKIVDFITFDTTQARWNPGGTEDWGGGGGGSYIIPIILNQKHF